MHETKSCRTSMPKAKEEERKYAASLVSPKGIIVEMVFQKDEQGSKTRFAIWNDTKVEYHDAMVDKHGNKTYPYSSDNELIKHGAVLLPSEATDYGTEAELVKEITEFIHRYVDISSMFERIAAHYSLFSWTYDRFNELPYLRMSGDYGSGKSRFLEVVGSICYRPMFASGAATPSPLFRMIDSFHGTLILDEGDFRSSDTTSDITKILNCGFQRGKPVLRSEGKDTVFKIRAFDVFSPKIIATRKKFEDIALESRCLTEEVEKKEPHELRQDIPLNMPDCFKDEALVLRNKLLMWRFRNYGKVKIQNENVDRTIEPRLAQITTPLLSVMEDEGVKADIHALAREYNDRFIADRHMGFEAEVFGAILDCIEDDEKDRPTMKEIAKKYNDGQSEFRDHISPRQIGHIVRNQLKLKSERGRGGFYLLSDANAKRYEILKKRYGYATKEPQEQVEGEHVNVVAVPAEGSKKEDKEPPATPLGI